MSIVTDRSETVLFDYFGGDFGERNVNVLVFHHRGPQIKVVDVNCIIFGTFCADGVINMQIDSG